MATIYERAMNELGLTIPQYSKLMKMPEKIIRNLLNGKELDEEMGLNEFLRNKAIERYNELESNRTEAVAEATKIKMEDAQTEPVIDDEFLMNWYDNEFETSEFLTKMGCSSCYDFIERSDIRVPAKGKLPARKASSTVYSRLLGKHKSQIGKELIYKLLPQLYDYYTGKKEIDHTPRKKGKYHYHKFTMDNISNDKKHYYKWFKEIDLKDFMKINNITKEEFIKKLEISNSLYYQLMSKSYKPSVALISRLQEFVNSYNVEEIEVLDTQEQTNETTKDYYLVKKENKDINDTNNDEMLKKLLVTRLTEEEKYLITLFGGRID